MYSIYLNFKIFLASNRNTSNIKRKKNPKRNQVQNGKFLFKNENSLEIHFSWKFAYEAIVNEEIRPRFECYKWENIKAHLDRCREYRSLHLQELTGKLTNEQKQRTQVMKFYN
jgi:hypothetical protein